MRTEGGRWMEPAPCLLLLLLWGYCLAVIDGEGELRCYCNESGCVSTGYMCKSPAGQCYTAVEMVSGEDLIRGGSSGPTQGKDHHHGTRATHGCVDTIPEAQRSLCGRAGLEEAVGGTASEDTGRGGGEGGGGGSEVVARGGDRPGGDRSDSLFPLLLCCGEDMCNYIENLDFSSITALTRGNGSMYNRGKQATGDRGVIYSRSGSGGGRGGPGSMGGNAEAEERDLWFKAAVIAVPIAGGFILVLLVLLAVRMLRTDSRQHRRLIQVRREQSLTKAQLYVTDHFHDVSSNVEKGCSFFHLLPQPQPQPQPPPPPHPTSTSASHHHPSQKVRTDHRGHGGRGECSLRGAGGGGGEIVGGERRDVGERGGGGFEERGGGRGRGGGIGGGGERNTLGERGGCLSDRGRGGGGRDIPTSPGGGGGVSSLMNCDVVVTAGVGGQKGGGGKGGCGDLNLSVDRVEGLGVCPQQQRHCDVSRPTTPHHHHAPPRPTVIRWGKHPKSDMAAVV
ncbi:hypothetical protein ACOMHN_053560 [Nucella lapillus]